MKDLKVVKRGRPAKQNVNVAFDSSSVKLFRGNELSFSEELFKPMVVVWSFRS